MEVSHDAPQYFAERRSAERADRVEYPSQAEIEAMVRESPSNAGRGLA